MNLKLRNVNEKLSVLVVDDDDDIREMLRSFLESMEIFTMIVEAKNGQDGYVKCQNQQFDMIITDLLMPKINGIDLINNIKALDTSPKGHKPSFIILSGNLTSDEVQKAIEMGVKNVIAKPCTDTDFINKVSTALVKEVRKKVMEV